MEIAHKQCIPLLVNSDLSVFFLHYAIIFRHMQQLSQNTADHKSQFKILQEEVNHMHDV